MKKKDIIDELSAQISDLKRDIRDLKLDVQKLLERDSVVKIVDQSTKPFLLQKLQGATCPSCNVDISKGNVCCMSTNCPYRMEVSCSTAGST